MNIAARGILPVTQVDVRQRKLPALTSLRFFAAAMIVALHAQGHFGIPAGIANTYSLGAGVSIFFVLSGFILTYVYPILPTRHETRRFLLARIARIWPAHIASTLFVLWLFGWFQLGQEGTVIRVLANLTMTQAWIPLSQIGSINTPSWTISTEFAFYLLFPFLIANFSRTWWWKLLGAFALAGLMIGVTSIFSLSYGGVIGLNGEMLTYMHPLARLAEFVLGMCAALAWRKAKPMHLNIWLGTVIEVTAIVLMFLSIQHLNPVEVSNPLIRWYYTSFEPAIPAAILIFVFASRRGWISRAMEAAWLVLLGEISYSIYLFHMPLLAFYWQIAPQTNVPAWAALAIFSCVLFTVSLATWYFIEQPARRQIRGYLSYASK